MNTSVLIEGGRRWLAVLVVALSLALTAWGAPQVWDKLAGTHTEVPALAGPSADPGGGGGG